MIRTIFRILIGVMGLLSLQGAWHHWFNVAGLANERGMKALGDIGQANIRADVGGIFLAIGLLSLIAAWRQSRLWALATIIVVGSALFGRFVSIALDGYSERVMQPITIEAVVLAILLGGYFVWKKKPEGL